MGTVVRFSGSYRKMPVLGVEASRSGNIKKFPRKFVERQFEDLRNSCTAAFVDAEEQCTLLTEKFEILNPRPVEPAFLAVHQFKCEAERLLKYVQIKRPDVSVMPAVQGCYSFACELKKLIARFERSAANGKSVLVPSIEIRDKIRYARQALSSVFEVPQRKPAQQ